ncbi:unnamed protein product, partial [Ectocarpus sp. 8 AP-2014]
LRLAFRTPPLPFFFSADVLPGPGLTTSAGREPPPLEALLPLRGPLPPSASELAPPPLLRLRRFPAFGAATTGPGGLSLALPLRRRRLLLPSPLLIAEFPAAVEDFEPFAGETRSLLSPSPSWTGSGSLPRKATSSASSSPNATNPSSSSSTAPTSSSSDSTTSSVVAATAAALFPTRAARVAAVAASVSASAAVAVATAAAEATAVAELGIEAPPAAASLSLASSAGELDCLRLFVVVAPRVFEVLLRPPPLPRRPCRPPVPSPPSSSLAKPRFVPTRPVLDLSPPLVSSDTAA